MGDKRKVEVAYRGRADIRRVGTIDGLTADYEFNRIDGKNSVEMPASDWELLETKQPDDFVKVQADERT